jgi:uncharacterized phage-associated protein
VIVSAHDVTGYILNDRTMTGLKLQKLLYYSQAWSLVWDDEPLFEERIEAWPGGPVVREVYCGSFEVGAPWPGGHPDRLSPVQRRTVSRVLKNYGSKPSRLLKDLTRHERPWLDARAKVGGRVRGEITHASMAQYYGSLIAR